MMARRSTIAAAALAVILLANTPSTTFAFQASTTRTPTSKSFLTRSSSNSQPKTVLSPPGGGGGGGSSSLSSSSLQSSTTTGSKETPPNQLDTDALGKYALAAGIQMSLFTGTFKLLDTLITSSGFDASSIPFPAVAFFFYFFSLKSRVFNPLNNQRPDRSKAMKGEEESGSAGFKDRVMPSWTPPGVFFPIMWLLIIGPIRAYTSARIFEANGNIFCDPTLLSLMFHLTCGDIWNTINNSEKRYGASVPGIVCVVASLGFAATQYYKVDEFAGRLLGATGLWLVTAGALIVDTWRLNPDGSSGMREPLYPVVGEVKTEFEWFASNKEEE